jgi:hypothetical protein
MLCGICQDSSCLSFETDRTLMLPQLHKEEANRYLAYI